MKFGTARKSYKTPNGYILEWKPGHPLAYSNHYVHQHVLVAESILKRPLTLPHVVHHVDEDKSNNAKSNLVICEDRAYHNLIHQRLRAYKATGNPESRKCVICKQWGMGLAVDTQNKAYHKPCAAQRAREYKNRWQHPVEGESKKPLA